jgi:predicted amidohydrolase
MYVAGAGMTGVGYCARSMVVDPLGVVLSGLAEAEGVTVAEISKERLAQARAKLPLVAQRRVASPVKP